MVIKKLMFIHHNTITFTKKCLGTPPPLTFKLTSHGIPSLVPTTAKYSVLQGMGNDRCYLIQTLCALICQDQGCRSGETSEALTLGAGAGAGGHS